MDTVSQVRQDKLATRFAQHDVDGDGFLTEADYQMLGTLLSDRLDAGAAGRAAIAAGFARQWQLLHTHADIDRDGRISLAEYISAMAGGIAADPEALDAAVLQTSRAVISAADADGDGFLDLSDFERLAVLLRVSGAAQGFDLLDTDGDGKLSLEEIITAVRDFYTSDDADTAGNSVFGQAG